MGGDAEGEWMMMACEGDLCEGGEGREGGLDDVLMSVCVLVGGGDASRRSRHNLHVKP